MLTLEFGGDGQHEVELDGYGTCLNADWVAPDLKGGLAAANAPYVSPAMPEYYNLHGGPVAYVRGTVPELSARFRAPEGAQSDVQIIGDVRAEFHVGEGKTELYQTRFSGRAKRLNGEWVADVLSCQHPLPAEIGYAEAFTIRWHLKTADGSPYDAGVSTVPLYLLRESPGEGVPLLHTTVNLACRAAAGLEEDAEIIDAVWQPFAARHVPRARDGQALAYYGAYHSTAGDLRGLLVAGTGQCTTWAFLQYAALGAMGIDSEVMMVMSKGKGGIMVRRWAHLDGARFISSGPNGICETTVAGDDEQAIEVGSGRPNTRAVEVVPAKFQKDQLKGDDIIRGRSWGNYLLTGPDGIVQTELDMNDFLPVVPLGFGVAQQRGYQITETEAEVVVSGDDSLTRDANGKGWVLTGPNGILETTPQDGMKSAAMGRVTVSLGKGSAGLNLHTYLPRRRFAQLPRNTGGDDLVHDDSWISTGPNGIVETAAIDGEEQVMPLGTGAPEVPVIGPGPDGVLNTEPAGDDTILDISDTLKLAGEDARYLSQVNIWPLAGVPGQRTSNPKPGFPNHVILKVGETIFDPSYGTGPFPDHATWEEASLAGRNAAIKDADGKRVGSQAVREGRLSYMQKLLSPH
ncbi:hypothetical protein DDZ13_05570 [Coraliomargarita sinensis]|uniref:Uncharacterized protein n=1 Tax=Coraliomargarita sinensis TaxID=2174842 RepID=A0A317ZML5_9BACT|nr:hypothetical protein DDZ13_05570 [Coraliomargarita sinensis]